MIKSLLGQGLGFVNAGFKSYCLVKFMAKTGMTYSDIVLYKDTVKSTSNYCAKKLSIFMKEYAQTRRAQRAILRAGGNV